MEVKELKKVFCTIYGQESQHVFFAPGRVNLIGEHTDYNGGFVFPCALSFGTFLLLAPNTEKKMRFCSLNVLKRSDCGGEKDVVIEKKCCDKTVYVTEIALDDICTPLAHNIWVNYPLGSIAQFVKRGIGVECGYDMLFWGDVPAGAGLSSSAAIEVVTAFAMNEMLGAGFDRTEIAKIGQLSEHEFAGVNCGIMDQFASAQGKKDYAIYLNCDSLDFTLVPVKLDGVKVVISNTHSPHKLDSGAYNARVAQCKQAVADICTVRPIKNLAELSISDFEEVKGAIKDDVARRRAHHVVSEVKRTKDAVEALQQGDITLFGELMNASHVSLRDDYEVTGKELDTLAEAAWSVDGVIGSRMTGGGFGGCTVSLVKEEAIPMFIETVGKIYTEITGLKADFYIAQIGDGAHRVG